MERIKGFRATVNLLSREERQGIASLVLLFLFSLTLFNCLVGTVRADNARKLGIICGDSSPRDHPVVIEVLLPEVERVLLPGDIIVRVGGEEVHFCGDVSAAAVPPQTEVEVVRNGSRLLVVVPTLEE